MVCASLFRNSRWPVTSLSNFCTPSCRRALEDKTSQPCGRPKDDSSERAKACAVSRQQSSNGRSALIRSKDPARRPLAYCQTARTGSEEIRLPDRVPSLTFTGVSPWLKLQQMAAASDSPGDSLAWKRIGRPSMVPSSVRIPVLPLLLPSRRNSAPEHSSVSVPVFLMVTRL